MTSRESREYPSRPGFVGWYIFLKPNLFAAKAVVSPIHATELSQCSDSEIRLTQALLQPRDVGTQWIEQKPSCQIPLENRGRKNKWCYKYLKHISSVLKISVT